MTLSKFVEDPTEPADRLPFPDALSTDLLDVVREHWSTIRTRVARGPVQTRFNYIITRLVTVADGTWTNPISSPTVATLTSFWNEFEKPTSCNGPSLKDRLGCANS